MGLNLGPHARYSETQPTEPCVLGTRHVLTRFSVLVLMIMNNNDDA